MAVLPRLVGRGGAAIDHLKLDHGEDDAPEALELGQLLEHGGVDAQREIDHEVEVAIRGPRRLVERAIVRLLVALQRHDLVLRLSGDDVVERKEVPGEVEDHLGDLIDLFHHHPEADLVVDLRGQRLALGQQLERERLARLLAALELDDRKPGVAQLLDHPPHLCRGERDEVLL